ncbi:hypothetical protein QO000_002081 [Alkalihalobacillus hemicentroti]|uniref:Uncharacterized protein n=1 Tax=Guptibacillus hwajinpoensis TaxID=208199 RepID=A0ABU0K188_9BACL|nr:hypothetical protein [Alkalihalobacillus hemicentroti]
MLTARPAESEHPGAEINHNFYLNNHYENSLLKIRTSNVFMKMKGMNSLYGIL